MDALRNKFKRTAVEFEPQGTRGASTVTCTAEMQCDGVRVGQLISTLCNRTSFLFLICIQKIRNEMKVEDGFRQAPPVEGHPFLDDPILPALLHRLCPSE